MNNQQKQPTKQYTHIKKAERLEIAILLKRGYRISEIARALDRSKGTISDEIKRNSVKRKYDPQKADHKAYVRRKYDSKYQGMKVNQDKQLKEYVEEKLNLDWSPEQISGRLKYVDTDLKYAGAKGIYKFVYSAQGGLLELRLRYQGKSKKPADQTKTAPLEGRLFIEKRPPAVNNRERFGDFEADFIVSGKNGSGALLVLHERKARYSLIKKIQSRSPDLVNRIIGELTGGFVCFNSLTLDNDIAFRKHEILSEILGAPVYFCHPYHSWEKGSVENTNKLIRQYVPKRTDISKLDDQLIKKIESKLNRRPRKCLNYKTPLEVMNENNQFKRFQTVEDFVNINLNEKTASVRLEGAM